MSNRPIRLGKPIAGFAYSYKRKEGAVERMVMGSFGRSQGRAKRRLNETIFLKGKNPECFKLYSIHLIPLAELDSNLIGGGDGFPVLDDDDDDGDGYPPFGNRKAPQGA